MSEELQSEFEAVTRGVNWEEGTLQSNVIWGRTYSTPVLLSKMLVLLCQSTSQGIWIERKTEIFLIPWTAVLFDPFLSGGDNNDDNGNNNDYMNFFTMKILSRNWPVW